MCCRINCMKVAPICHQKSIVLWISEVIESSCLDLLLLTDFPSGNSLIGVYVLRGFAAQLTIYSADGYDICEPTEADQAFTDRAIAVYARACHPRKSRRAYCNGKLWMYRCFLLRSGVLHLHCLLYLPMLPVKNLVAYYIEGSPIFQRTNLCHWRERI